MESIQSQIKLLEIKIKSLEIENQKLSSIIEANNKQIKEIKSLIQSITENKSTNVGVTASLNEESKEIELKFKWKISKTRQLLCELKNDFKTIKKISGHGIGNCTVVGDKCLIKGKINKWKIQVNTDLVNILFGIIPANIDLNGIDNWKKAYSTSLANFNKHNLGICSPTYNHKAKKGDTVEIIVDLKKGELSYSLNDMDLGIFCDNILKTNDYVPFVDIWDVGAEIVLLE